jgi:hypothetical protein
VGESVRGKRVPRLGLSEFRGPFLLERVTCTKVQVKTVLLAIVFWRIVWYNINDKIERSRT